MALWIPNYGIRTGRPSVRPSDFFNASRSLGQGTKAPWMWDGLVGWWLFVAGGGDKAYDFSGYGNHGDLEASMNDADWVVNDGSEPRMWLPRALDFDGSDDYVNIVDTDSVDMGTSDFTLSAWFKSASVSESKMIAIKMENSSPYPGYACYLDSLGRLRCDVQSHNTSNSFRVYSNAEFDDDTWHQAVWSVDRSEASATDAIKVYADGILQARTADTEAGNITGNINNANDLHIGVSRDISLGNYFNGLLDDVRIYNRALSASEVSQLYNHGSHIVEPRPTQVFLPASVPTANTDEHRYWHPHTFPVTKRQVKPFDFYQAARNRGQGTKAPWMWDGLVGWWPFIAGGGDKAYDFSGRGNHGDLEASMNDADWVVNDGSEPRMWLPRALDFDGSDDYVDLSSYTSTYNAYDIGTLVSWVKSTDDTAGVIYGITEGSTSNNYLSIVSGPSTGTLTDELIAIHRRIGGSIEYIVGYTTATRTELFDGNWHNVVVSWDGSSSTKIYLDGVSKTVSVGTGSDNGKFGDVTSADSVEIGASKSSNSQVTFFNGLLSDIRIYNRALSASEVSQLYNHGSHIVEPRPTLVSFAGVSVMPWLYVNPAQIIGGGVI